MITELTFKSIKTLRDVRLPLSEGLTVIVGANNSGKSNALAALKFLGGVAQQGNVAALESAGLVARGQSAARLQVKGEFGPDKILYDLSIGSSESESVTIESSGGRVTWSGSRLARSIGDGHGSSIGNVGYGEMLRVLGGNDQAIPFHHFYEAIANLQVLDLSVPSIRAEASLEANPQLGPDGQNLAAVLDHLSNTQPDLMESLLREIGPPTTNIKRLLTPSGRAPGTKVVGIQEQDGSVYRAGEISDGLLLFIAMSVAVQLGGRQPSLIAIEEPERGIHPRRIRDVVDQFRRIAAKGTQVVMTTHSPILLDEFRDSPESVVIFDRDETGTHIHRLSDHPDWKEGLLRDQPLGDLWYSGLLGGAP